MFSAICRPFCSGFKLSSVIYHHIVSCTIKTTIVNSVASSHCHTQAISTKTTVLSYLVHKNVMRLDRAMLIRYNWVENNMPLSGEIMVLLSSNRSPCCSVEDEMSADLIFIWTMTRIKWWGSKLVVPVMASRGIPDWLRDYPTDGVFFNSSVLGWGLLKLCSSISPSAKVSIWQKYLLHSLNLIHVWQVSLQLSCGDTCQIWMWYSIANMYFCDVEKLGK